MHSKGLLTSQNVQALPNSLWNNGSSNVAKTFRHHALVHRVSGCSAEWQKVIAIPNLVQVPSKRHKSIIQLQARQEIERNTEQKKRVNQRTVGRPSRPRRMCFAGMTTARPLGSYRVCRKVPSLPPSFLSQQFIPIHPHVATSIGIGAFSIPTTPP